MRTRVPSDYTGRFTTAPVLLCPTPWWKFRSPVPTARWYDGRAGCVAAGHYSFSTLTPGAPAGRAPFFAIVVFARGLLNRVFTRAYLPDGDLAADRLLSTLDATRRRTLICSAEKDGYRFDIHLQGASETVFLAYRGDPG
jgi:protocatechuate 3,4-dioxygenase alpha subunit